MKNTFKLIVAAFVMFAFSTNVGAMTLNVNQIAKSLIVDQDGNGGVKVKKSCDKDGEKKECNKDGKKKSCCQKDGKKDAKKSCHEKGGEKKEVKAEEKPVE